jgi:glycosyltransferase involved in cell wall biosynthesis
VFSIIIPTYNRSDVLSRTLHEYLKQTSLSLIKELIVIDDGSTDNTKSLVEDFIKSSPIKTSYIYQKNKGPAEARNKGIRSASGDILLITGDDIVPSPRMVEEHYLTHKIHSFDPKVSILGKTIWPPSERVTPFMSHIQENGLQFGYSLIEDKNNVPFKFFYTSNISLNREFLIEDKLFDTDFPYAAWEDIELGYRLMRRGMRIVYDKNAIGYHHHRVSFASFRRREELCGYSAYIFFKKHPELKEFLGLNNSLSWSPFFEASIKIMEIICLLADNNLSLAFPNIYDQIMEYYYKKGLKKGLENLNFVEFRQD